GQAAAPRTLRRRRDPAGAMTSSTEQPAATPPPTGFADAGSRYFEPVVETMPRDRLRDLQEERLLATVAHAYANSGLVREVWDDARVTPRDVRGIDDFLERAPFIDKDRIRAYRDRHRDPYGGILCVPESELKG